jgi:hypothetical protein
MMRWHWGWWFGLAVGSAAMYFLDSERGSARRRRVAERARTAMRRRELRNATRARDEARDAMRGSSAPVMDAGAWSAAV